MTNNPTHTKQWIEENKHNLVGLDLCEADLRGANLKGANLGGAGLSRAVGRWLASR